MAFCQAEMCAHTLLKAVSCNEVSVKSASDVQIFFILTKVSIFPIDHEYKI